MPIEVSVLADSLNVATKRRLTSFLLRYPRFIHSEVMTHRVFERNSASSRAIPTAKLLAEVLRDPAMPVRWGKMNRGMQDAGPLPRGTAAVCRALWRLARYPVVGLVWLMLKLGLAKQVANRLLEPWCWMTVVLTGTEWANFYRLRAHKDAQPEICELATQMLRAHAASEPRPLQPGEWHLPFIRPADELAWAGLPEEVRVAWSSHAPDDATRSRRDGTPYFLRLATARCARVSYVNFYGKDDPAEDAKLHDRLRASGHHSPFGHSARAESADAFFANLRGFRPYRNVLGGDTFDGAEPFDPKALATELGLMTGVSA